MLETVATASKGKQKHETLKFERKQKVRYYPDIKVHGPTWGPSGADRTQVGPMLAPRSLQWRHNGGDSVSNHQPHDCLLNRLFRRRSKKTSKPRVTGLCVGNSPRTGEFPAQMASYAENVSIWWRHHELCYLGSVFSVSYISEKDVNVFLWHIQDMSGNTILNYVMIICLSYFQGHYLDGFTLG